MIDGQNEHQAHYPKSLMAKLNRAMQHCAYLQKTGRNRDYNYAEEPEVLRLVREALTKENLFVIQSVDNVEVYDYVHETKQSSRTVHETRVDMSFIIVDAETGESLPPVQFSGTSATPGDKQVYVATTSCAKYFWLKTFLIPTGDDAEREDHAQPSRASNSPAQSHSTNTQQAATITDDQARGLRRLVLDTGVDPQQFALWLTTTYGVENLRELSPDAARNLMESVQEPGFADGLAARNQGDEPAHLGATPATEEPTTERGDVVSGDAGDDFEQQLARCTVPNDYVQLLESARAQYGEQHPYVARAREELKQAAEKAWAQRHSQAQPAS